MGLRDTTSTRQRKIKYYAPFLQTKRRGCYDIIAAKLKKVQDMNFLEQLVAEWYEYERYFVRSNVRARKRARGGWDMELDVLAYDPVKNALLHIEASGDADSWTERKHRFMTKKFILAKEEYEGILGRKVRSIKKIAIVGWSRSTTADLNWGQDIEVVLIPSFMKRVAEKLHSQHPTHEAVPEGFTILRAIQTVLAYGIQDIQAQRECTR